MRNQVGVGMRVLYQTTPGQGPTAYYQHAAIITGWDEDTQLASLMVFHDGTPYTTASNGISEGTDDRVAPQPRHSCQSVAVSSHWQHNEDQRRSHRHPRHRPRSVLHGAGQDLLRHPAAVAVLAGLCQPVTERKKKR